MSLPELFHEDTWNSAWTQLRGVPQKWWEEHKDTLTNMAKDEAEDVFRAMRQGQTDEAKMAVIAAMSREEWVAYRDGTTAQLRGIAQRRAELLDALEDLGRRAARIIGGAAMSALGG